jgi:ATP-dependent Clp protease ATP-binding subunit ClpB
VDFKNAVIALTSNIGSNYIAEDQGRDPNKTREEVLTALKAHFRPEFLNRVDDLVIFNSLSPADLKAIVRLQVALLAKRIADRKLTLILSEAAVEFLARVGFDPVYGARPIKRAIQTELLDLLATSLLSGEVLDGQTLYVEYDPDADKLVIRAKDGDHLALAATAPQND